MDVVAGGPPLPHLGPHAHGRARRGDPRPAHRRAGSAPRRARSEAPRRRTAASFEDDLRDSRGCLLEAGGQVDDALEAGRVPVLLAGDCSIAATTLPAALGHRPDARVLWLDAHADYNTPATTASGYLGGHVPCPPPAASGTRASAARSRRRGWCSPASATSTRGERPVLDAGGATVVGASVVETLVAVKNALDGAPVYVHVDLDVIDPEHFPAQFPAPRRPAPGEALRPGRGGDRRLRARGPRGHRVRGARGSGRSTPRRPRPPCACSTPFLDRLARGSSE